MSRLYLDDDVPFRRLHHRLYHPPYIVRGGSIGLNEQKAYLSGRGGGLHKMKLLGTLQPRGVYGDKRGGKGATGVF